MLSYIIIVGEYYVAFSLSREFFMWLRDSEFLTRPKLVLFIYLVLWDFVRSSLIIEVCGDLSLSGLINAFLESLCIRTSFCFLIISEMILYDYIKVSPFLEYNAFLYSWVENFTLSSIRVLTGFKRTGSSSVAEKEFIYGWFNASSTVSLFVGLKTSKCLLLNFKTFSYWPNKI